MLESLTELDERNEENVFGEATETYWHQFCHQVFEVFYILSCRQSTTYLVTYIGIFIETIQLWGLMISPKKLNIPWNDGHRQRFDYIVSFVDQVWV